MQVTRLQLAAMLGLGACSFPTTGSGASDADPTQPDADLRAPDAAIDAPSPDAPPPVCNVIPTGTEIDGGTCGGFRGGEADPMVCPTDTWAVGLAIDFSDQMTFNNGRSAYAVELLCASVRFVADLPVLGPITRIRTEGTGQFDWTPATLSPDARCASGSVIVGMRAFTGTEDELFANFTIVCAPLNGAGQLGPPTDVPVTDTGTLNNNVSEASCGTGAVTSLAPRTGAGLDALGLACRAPSCAP